MILFLLQLHTSKHFKLGKQAINELKMLLDFFKIVKIIYFVYGYTFASNFTWIRKTDIC